MTYGYHGVLFYVISLFRYFRLFLENKWKIFPFLLNLLILSIHSYIVIKLCHVRNKHQILYDKFADSWHQMSDLILTCYISCIQSVTCLTQVLCKRVAMSCSSSQMFLHCLKKCIVKRAAGKSFWLKFVLLSMFHFACCLSFSDGALGWSCTRLDSSGTYYLKRCTCIIYSFE